VADFDLRLGLEPCPACVREASAVISDVAGVRTVRFEPLTRSIRVTGGASRSEVETVLRAAGYRLGPSSSEAPGGPAVRRP
jgi:hypothetical protein